jgi:hypothetical protein
MKNAVLAACLLALAPGVYAGSQDIFAANNLVLMQFTSTRVDYREYGNGFMGTQTGLIDREAGPVPGIALSASGMSRGSGFYWQASYAYSSGHTNYTGALMGGAYGSYVGVSSAVLEDYGARLGKGFPFRDAFVLTPYVEVGRHEWERGINYGEVYSHYYYGPGLMGQYSAASRVVLSANVLYGRTTGSHINVISGPLLNGFSAALGDSALWRVGVGADYAFDAQVHGKISVDVIRFRYGMSAPYPVGANMVAWEPDSQTRYVVVKIGVGVAF